MSEKYAFDKCLAAAMASIIPSEVVADLAAQQRAECDIFSLAVRDGVMPEIVLGDALVIVAYGSKQSCENIKRILIEGTRPLTDSADPR